LRRYAEQIRLEYHHVPPSAFPQARAAVLAKFLDTPALYFTTGVPAGWRYPAFCALVCPVAARCASSAEMRDLLEAAARENLSAEIHRLTHSSRL
jgi:predicted metal-dependent HD superfamily phosphohydrolase